MTRHDLIPRLRHALRLMPALIRHDPLFRYAGIAAVFFLIVLIGRGAQWWAGPGPIPPTPDRLGVNGMAPAPVQPQVPNDQKPDPAAAAPAPAPPVVIAPGRKLDGVTINPAPADRFGTLPQGTKKP